MAIATAVLGGAYLFLDDTLSAAAPDTPEAQAARRLVESAEVGEPINILLIGSDQRSGEGARSDTLILVRMNAPGDYVSMLSFPRDLYVDIPGLGQDKLNAAFGYGGAVATIATVEGLTGVEVNEYLVVDFNGFEALVNEVGGVYIDVDRRYFNDNSGCVPGSGGCYETIDLRPGYQRLGGVDALDYVRYRHTDDDFARIARQQQFLSDLKRQTNRLSNLGNIPAFRDIFERNIETSITDPRVLLTILDLALTLPDDRIARYSIDGGADMVGGASIVRATTEEIQTKVGLWRSPEFPGEEQPARTPPARVQTVVLNGNGRPMGAAAMVDALADKGYQAVNGGNADSHAYTDSVVRYAPQAYDEAQAIESLLGPPAVLDAMDEEDIAAAGGADVVVVVGGNFAGTLYEPPPPPEPAPPATIDTESLVNDALRGAQRELGMKVMVPLKVAQGSRLRRLRAYRIAELDTGSAPALKLVFDAPGRAGRRAYWGIMMTTMEDPPILQGRTGVIDSGGRAYSTYYDGRDLQRIAFQVDGVTYWISNTLDYDLSPKTMLAIAKSMRPVATAKLPPGRESTPIEVALDAPTP